jgi:phage terminase large subunit-like protein
VAGFQRRIIDTLYDNRAAIVSLPAGNGKTTLLAAIALERICRGDDYVEVDVVATKQEQAAMLVEAAKRMVEASPLLSRSAQTRTSLPGDGVEAVAQPAKLSAIKAQFQSRDVDEIGFARRSCRVARPVGKRPTPR